MARQDERPRLSELLMNDLAMLGQLALQACRNAMAVDTPSETQLHGPVMQFEHGPEVIEAIPLISAHDQQRLHAESRQRFRHPGHNWNGPAVPLCRD